MIYTIVPLEQLLLNEGVYDAQNVQAVYMGERVILSLNENGEYTVSRLLSTNPQSFLKGELYPGTKADTGKIRLNK